MNCSCKVNQRRLVPGVFNLKQYLNGTETMVWTFDSNLANNGQCDLCKYDAFLVLCVCGEIDEIMLTMQMDGDKLQLVWDVGHYATALSGHVKYQIVFRSKQIDTLGVISTNAAVNGVYKIEDELAEGTGRVFVNSASNHRVKWDAENARWALFDDGGAIVDYQTFVTPEPYNGTWNINAVGNATAAVWASDEAVMYISETIAADQSITANYPTILRQFWENVQKMVIKSGVSVVEAEIKEDEWFGENAPFYVTASNYSGIPQGCSIVDVRLVETRSDGTFVDVANIKHQKNQDGSIRIYAPEKVKGKLVVTIKGGNGHFYVSEDFLKDNAELAAIVDELAEDVEELKKSGGGGGGGDAGLANAVAELETDVANLSAGLENLSAEVDGLKQSGGTGGGGGASSEILETLESELEIHEAHISDLEFRVSDLASDVLLLKENGTGGGGGGGSIVLTTDYNPVLSPTFRDAENGRYCRLDDEYNTITVAENVIDASMVRLHTKSADRNVSGVLRLRVDINGTIAEYNVNAGAAEWIDLVLPHDNGIMTITRDTESSVDTLKSGNDVISAIIDAVEIVYER